MTPDEVLAHWELVLGWSTHSPDRVSLVLDEQEKSATPEAYDSAKGRSWERIHKLLWDERPLVMKQTKDAMQAFLSRSQKDAWDATEKHLNKTGGEILDTWRKNFLPMKWDWLLVWFARRLLGPGSKLMARLSAGTRKSNTSGCYTTAESVECVRNLACFAIYALHAIRNDDPAPLHSPVSELQFARALIFLVSEYGHLELGLTRRFCVESALRNMLQMETGMYLTEGYYRDHTFHVIFVFLLGEFLLECKIWSKAPSTASKTFLDRLLELCKGKGASTKAFGGLTRERFRRNWFVTALFHDLGYPISIFWDISKQIKFIESDDISELIKVISDAGKSQLEPLNKKAAEKLSVAHLPKNKLDHGVASALHLRHLLERVKDETLTEELRPALKAIACHHLNGTEFRACRDAIRTKTTGLPIEPVTFLLVLCDEVQEFARIMVDTIRYREEVAAKTQFGGGEPLAQLRSLNYILLNVRPRSGQTATFEFTCKGIHIDLLYRQLTRAEESYLAVWLGRTRNLQRMVLPTENVLPIVVGSYWTQSEERFDVLQECDDVHLLASYARNSHEWDLDAWIQDALNPGGAIDYVPACEAGKKTPQQKNNKFAWGRFVINVNKLSQKPLLPSDPNIEKIYKWFRAYPARANSRRNQGNP